MFQRAQLSCLINCTCQLSFFFLSFITDRYIIPKVTVNSLDLDKLVTHKRVIYEMLRKLNQASF